MRVPGEDIRSDFENHVIAAIVCLRLGDHKDERRLIGHAVVDRDHGAIGDREDVLAETIVLLDPLAVVVEDSVVLDSGPVDGEGLGSLDADTVYRYTKVSVDVGLAATASREPALPLKGRPDHHGPLAVDGDFWCVNLPAADQQSKLRIRLEGVSDPVRDPFRRGVWRQDQIDVN